MKIISIPHDFSVCRVSDYSSVDFYNDFTFACKTDEENSLVTLTRNVPSNTVKRDDGWRAFKIDGVLDFSLIGILAKIATILADNKIGIFAVSTYNTDYILTKKENFARALDVLQKAGYDISK